MGAEWFFADHDDWARIERDAFEHVDGRVLDIGAGAGRHSLVAQRRQLESVAIDISPGAVEVCRRRGLRDAQLLPLAEIDESLGAFDTVLLLCGNFGLAGGLGGDDRPPREAALAHQSRREDRARHCQSV